MNEGIALRGVHIERFRCLGGPSEFELAPGPGITILVGPNGSGKSTVLDAIEWTLTEGASRLPVPSAASKRAPSIFRTLGADDDPRVVLSFDSVAGGRRLITSGDGEQRVADVLRRLEKPWSDIRSVAAALRWTHFSSQRSTARLGYEDGDAILKHFAAPAGLERLKGLDRRLWGRDTRLALGSAEDKMREQATRHRAALERLRQLETPRGGVAGSSLARRLSELRDLLLAEQDLPFEREVDDLAVLEDRLSGFQTAIERRLAEVRSIGSLLRDGDARLARLSVEKDEAEQSLATAERVAARRYEALALSVREREARQLESDRLVATRAKLADRLSANAELLELETSKRSLRVRLAEARSQADAVRTNLIRLDRLSELQGRLRAMVALREADDGLQQLGRFGDPEAVRVATDEQVVELTARREDLARRRGELQATLSQENDRLQSMVALTSAIAGHLHEDDTVCPVCAAVYPPRELAARARAVAIAPGPAAQEITRILGEVTQELGSLSGQLRLAASRRDEAVAVSANVARLRAERERLLGLVGSSPNSAVSIEELDTQVVELRTELNVSDDADLALRRAGLEDHKVRLRPLVDDLEHQVELADQAVTAVVPRALADRPDAELRS